MKFLILVLPALVLLGCSPEHSDNSRAEAASLRLEVDMELQGQSLHILQSYCANCHGDKATGKVHHITDVDHLLESGLIIVGQPLEGRLMQSILEGTMPPRGGSLDSKDIQTLKDWIASMKMVPNT